MSSKEEDMVIGLIKFADTPQLPSEEQQALREVYRKKGSELGNNGIVRIRKLYDEMDNAPTSELRQAVVSGFAYGSAQNLTGKGTEPLSEIEAKLMEEQVQQTTDFIGKTYITARALRNSTLGQADQDIVLSTSYKRPRTLPYFPIPLPQPDTQDLFLIGAAAAYNDLSGYRTIIDRAALLSGRKQFELLSGYSHNAAFHIAGLTLDQSSNLAGYFLKDLKTITTEYLQSTIDWKRKWDLNE